jgi:hypothetical protein
MFRAIVLVLSSIFILMTGSSLVRADSEIPRYGENGEVAEFEQGEILVVNPSKTFSEDVIGQGFTVIESLKLEGLKMELQRLRIPDSMTVPFAIKILSARYPNLEIEANQVIGEAGEDTQH